VLSGIEIIQQPLRVERAAGTGDGDEDFQNLFPFVRSMAESAGSKQVRA
jgi:hypothetical protein